MVPLVSTYTDVAAPTPSGYFRREQPSGGAPAASQADGTTPAAQPTGTSSTAGEQRGSRDREEFSPYGADGRLKGEKRSPAASSATDHTRKTAPGANSLEDPRVQQEISRLKAIDTKVRAHETAHKAAGGTMTGPVSYSYTRGPDGKNYVTGGEVPISVTPGNSPRETASRMQQVIQAALAPADPSAQDRAVAAQAAALAQRARQEESTAGSPASGASASPDAPGSDDETQPATETGGNPGHREGNAETAVNGAADSHRASGEAGQQTEAPHIPGAAEPAVNGVVARISRNAYGNPAVTGTPDASLPSPSPSIAHAPPALSRDFLNPRTPSLSGASPPMPAVSGVARRISFYA